MCNLYRMTKGQAEVARLFRVEGAQGANVGEEIYPGHPGLVVANRRLQSMVWGFPLAGRSKRTGRPLKPRAVNNARSDKLDSFMWRYSFEERRCLVPVTAWAEAEGARGAMTRTWLSLPGTDTFAVAGIWRHSDEWGPCYAMVMAEAAGEAAKVHARMPVLLSPDRYDEWMTGSPVQARDLCRPYAGELRIERTDRRWRS